MEDKKNQYIENSTGDLYELICRMDRENLNVFVAEVSKAAPTIDIHLGRIKSYAKFTVCFTCEEVIVSEGNYLLRSEKTVPQTIPPLHYYISVREEELSKNFKPLSVTE